MNCNQSRLVFQPLYAYGLIRLNFPNIITYLYTKLNVNLISLTSTPSPNTSKSLYPSASVIYSWLVSIPQCCLFLNGYTPFNTTVSLLRIFFLYVNLSPVVLLCSVKPLGALMFIVIISWCL